MLTQIYVVSQRVKETQKKRACEHVWRYDIELTLSACVTVLRKISSSG